MTTTQLAVIIVSWNVRDLLERCLDTLLAEFDSAPITAHVIVVDNASRDGSTEMIRARFPQVELIALEDNLGFAGGNNVGLSALGLPRSLAPSPDAEKTVAERGRAVSFLSSNSSSISGERGRGDEAILLLNPDTEVRPGAIKTLLEVLRDRSDAAIVTAHLSYGDGSFQHSAFYFPGLGQLYVDLFPVPGRLYESRLNGRYPRRLYDSSQPFEIDTPLGAVMLLRREAIEQVGVFDEGFALYCEEIDWAARFKEAGWQNLCVPAAHVMHHAGQSTAQARIESFVKLWTARYRLHQKHPQFAPLWLARWIVTSGMKRRMKNASDEMRTACQKIIDVWHGG